MKLHRYTKSFIRLLKEEKLYNAFLNGVRNRYSTHKPLKIINNLISLNASSISKKYYLSSLVDMCFSWDSGIISEDEFERIFYEATKAQEDLKYCNHE